MLPEILQITSLYIFLFALVIGFFSPLTASGGILVIAFMMSLGLSPQEAIAVSMFSSSGSALITFFKMKKADKVNWNFVPAMIVITVVGNVLGSYIVVNIAEDTLQHLVGYLILFAASVIALHKNLGVEVGEASSGKIIIGFILYFLISIYAGFFVGGSGILLRFVALTFFGFTVLQSSGTGSLPWSIAAASSCVLFVYHDVLPFMYAIPMVTGASIGAYIGTHMAIKKGERWVKLVFVCITYLTALYFLISVNT